MGTLTRSTAGGWWRTSTCGTSCRASRADRAALYARLSGGVREDLRAMAARYETSTPIVRDAARDVYDSYLRANRVREGIASYSGIVRLMLGTGVAERRMPALSVR